MVLADEFGASKHAAIRRYVEHSNKRCALIVLKNINKKNQSAELRNYFQSDNFTSDFGNLEWPKTMDIKMPFIVDMSYNRRFHEAGTMTFKDKQMDSTNFQYHFFNNHYNIFVFLMPVGEKIKSKTKIIVNSK
jgi:hypothetical protein